MDQNGYLVNSAGEYLQGWQVDPTTGVANQSQLSTIQITQSQFNPVPTSDGRFLRQPAHHREYRRQQLVAGGRIRFARQSARGHAELDAESGPTIGQ